MLFFISPKTKVDIRKECVTMHLKMYLLVIFSQFINLKRSNNYSVSAFGAKARIFVYAFRYLASKINDTRKGCLLVHFQATLNFLGRDFDSSVDVALKRVFFNIYSEEYFLFCSSFQNINMFLLQEKEEIFNKVYID